MFPAQASARSAAVRHARAVSKRDLKTGQQSLAQALEEDYWQDKTVMELVGYAMCRRTVPVTGKRAPSSAGVLALNVISRMTPHIDHWTKVRALSPSRRERLCEAVSASGYEARLRLAEARSPS